MTVYTYEFAAFTEESLLNAGSGNGSNLGYGDSFTMPASSDTQFVVTDNDAYLSGDSRRNENSNDHSYQTAEIIVDGVEAGNGGQIYGEQYFWVWGEDSGQWYLMIEIEQEGTNDDYFTFYNSYGVPADGETLTIYCGGNISCWQPNMNNLESPPSTTPPVAVLDAITITEGDAIGDATDDAQLNILANDFDTDGTITLTDVNGAAPGSIISVTTEGGITVDVMVDANGNLHFDSGSAFDALRLGESDTLVLTYTITDDDGNMATTTATITIEGEESPPDAIDDAITVSASETTGDNDGNVLTNDIDPEGDALSVVEVNSDATLVAQTVTGSNGGTVVINTDGSFDFSANGEFDSLRRGETADTTFTYSISDGRGDVSLQKQNIVFVVDVSGSTSPAQFEGTAVGDQNGDGIANSVLDAEIAAYKALSAEIASLGLDADMVDIGLVIFSGNNGSDQSGASQIVGTFEPGSAALENALNGLSDGGWTNFEAPMQQTVNWFNDVGATTDDNNVVYFLSDGMQNRGGDWTDEVAQLEASYDASIVAVGVGNGAVLSELNTVDNTGGAEIVTSTDQLTAALIDGYQYDFAADDTATLTVTVVGENHGPEAADDSVRIDEDGTVGPDAADNAQLNILANDSDYDGDALTILSAGGVAPGQAITVTTANGVTTTVTVDANGELVFDTAGQFDAMVDGQTDSFQLTYIAQDGFGGTAEATVTVVIDGAGGIDAIDDVYTVLETETAGDIEGNVLTNDTSDFGAIDAVLRVEGQEANVGEWLNLADGGRVMLKPNGELDFDANGDFDSLNAGDSAELNITYTIAYSDGGETEEYQCLFFGGHSAGTVIEEQYLANGVRISSLNANNPVMIFDTNNPTGGDWDLASSTRGNVLILSEDGDSADPDDNAGGGTFVFEFDREADVESLVFLDTEEPTPVIRLYDEGGALIATMNGPSTVDGGEGIANINTAGVFRMEVELQGSGAVDNLIYTLKGSAPVYVEDTANVKIIVDGLDDPNAPPVAEDNVYTTDEETAVSGNILTDESPDGLIDRDDDNDPLTVTEVLHNGVAIAFDTATTLFDAAGAPLGVIVVSADGSYTFTPDASLQALGMNDSEVVDLTYTITDGLATSSAAVQITINGLNDLADGDETAAVDEGSGATPLTNALANVVENDGGTPVITAVAGVLLAVNGGVAAGSEGGIFTIDATGAVTFDTNGAFTALNPGDSAFTSITYTVEDGQGGSVTSTYTVEVKGTNEGPVASNDTVTILENQALPTDATLNILANDVDPNAGDSVSISGVDGATLDPVSGVYTIVTTTTNGVPVTVQVSSTGDVTFDTGSDFTTMAASDSDSVSFTYTITDGIPDINGDLPTSTATATINIEGVNEAPVAIDNTYLVDEGAGLTVANVLTDDDNGADAGGVDFDPNGDTFAVNTALGKDANGDLTVDILSGAFQTVYTEAGAAVQVRLDANGALEMQDGGEIAGLGAGQTDSIVLNYTTQDNPASGPAAQSNTATVTIDITGQDSTPTTEFNIAFLVDSSLSAFAPGASPIAVADLNGDGADNTVFDASLEVVRSLLGDFGAAGIGSGVDVGIFSFDSNINGDVPVHTIETLGDSLLNTTLDPTTDLSGIYANANGFGHGPTSGRENGTAVFDAAIGAANDFFGRVDVDGANANAANLVFLISDSAGQAGSSLDFELTELSGYGANTEVVSLGFGTFAGPLSTIDSDGVQTFVSSFSGLGALDGLVDDVLAGVII